MIPTAKAKLLDGKRCLVVGVANENSIAWGCAKAFRALGADVAVTYVNDKSREYVEPFAQQLDIFDFHAARRQHAPANWRPYSNVSPKNGAVWIPRPFDRLLAQRCDFTGEW